MKKFQNAEIVELNIQATAQYNPESKGWDAQWADDKHTEIDPMTLRHGDPYPSGDETGIHIDMP